MVVARSAVRLAKTYCRECWDSANGKLVSEFAGVRGSAGWTPASGWATHSTLSRRSNALHRCSRCRLHRSLCLCAMIPRLETRTRVVLMIHRLEDRKATNTGRLATECLVNSEVRVHGFESRPSEAFCSGADRQ